MSARPFIIAEAGVNHNGDIGRALEMIDAAADAGADCVKFQAFEPEKLIARGTEAAAYQTRNTGELDQLEMIRSFALRLKDFETLAERCRTRGIEFLATAFDLEMLGCLVGLGMRRAKIASGELTNKPELIACAKLGLPVVVSTGMANDEEVDWAIAVLREAGAGDITVLQCTSIYPAPPETVNLMAMVAMGTRNGVPFGYSDHTLGDHVALAAVALGASIIEKHFTLDRTLAGPDHQASLTPDELSLMIRRIRDVCKALGSSCKEPGEEELATAALVRRSWHAARNLNAGETLSEGDMTPMRPAAGVTTRELIAGHTLRAPIAKGAAITREALCIV